MGNLFCVAGVLPNTLECSYWSAIPANQQSVEIAYSDLVPSGETRPLRIHDGFLRLDNLAPATITSHSLLIESPAESSKWKFPLAWLYDADGKHVSSMHFSQPVTLSSGDMLCFDHWNTSTYSGGSFAIHYIIGP